jgi:penicillin-binding protein 1A
MTEKIQSNVYRTIVPIENIPSDVQKAFIAIEDERFYEHNGVDVKRVFGAIIHDIKARSLEQGASTISMQLSKNLLTSSKKSAMRKVTDAVYAMELEKRFSKTQILYAYLNSVFLGSNVNGVQAAAKSYFNKNIQDVNLAEAAVLAGITKYPVKYIPYKLSDITENDDLSSLQIKMYDPEKKYTPTEADLDIYRKLRNSGKIDQYEYILLKQGSLVVAKAELNPDAISRQKVILKKMFELGFINNSRYTEALATPIKKEFPPRNNSGMSSYFNDKVKKEVIKILVSQGNTEESANEMLKFGGLKIHTTLNSKIQKILEYEFSLSENFPNSFTDKDNIIQPQAAMVVIDQKTGYVKALIGGRGQAGSFIYDRSDNPRQPGSAIKPLAVYLLALKDGMTPNSIINDSPRRDSTSPTGYWPSNIFGIYYGNATMKKLIQVSANVAAVKTLESLGKTRAEAVSRSLDYLEEMGFKHLVRRTDDPVNNDENLALALGGLTHGVTPLEMASAYSGIANLGKQVKPTFITKIVDRNDSVIYENTPEIFTMIDESNAYKMTTILESVITSGSGKAATLDKMPAAGKTGTTDDKKDVYFVGYTPYFTAAVWIGADNPVELNYTSAIPATLWKNVMNRIKYSLNLSYKAFDLPTKIEANDIISDQPENDDTSGTIVNDNTIKPNENQNLDGVLFEGEKPNQNSNTVPNNDNQIITINPEQGQTDSNPQQPEDPQQPAPQNNNTTQPTSPTNENATPPSTTGENSQNQGEGSGNQGNNQNDANLILNNNNSTDNAQGNNSQTDNASN